MDRAVLVTAWKYPCRNPLPWAKHDKEQVKRWLRHELGAGLDDEQVLDVDNPSSATEVNQQIARLVEGCPEGSGGTLYVYFSGHGVQGTDKSLHFCLHGYDRSDPVNFENLFQAELYLRDWCRSDRFRHVVFLYDCCRHSANGTTTIGDQSLGGLRHYKGGVSALACQPGRSAYERDLWLPLESMSELGEPVKMSWFTSAVLQGLWGDAVTAEERGVDPQELGRFVSKRMKHFSMPRYEQIPEFRPIESWPDTAFRIGHAVRKRRVIVVNELQRPVKIVLLGENDKTVELNFETATGEQELDLSLGNWVPRYQHPEKPGLWVNLMGTRIEAHPDAFRFTLTESSLRRVL